MKILSTALLAAGLVALGGCGDSAANNVTTDTYNVAPDDLGTDNLLGNETLGNDVLDANLTADNALTTDTTTNAAGNSQ